jgi:hypothetical protein
VLDGKHSDRTFPVDDRNTREAVEMLLAGLGAIDELRMARRFGKVQDPAFGSDHTDEPFAGFQPRDVHRFLAKAVSRKQLKLVVAQQIDRADLAPHFVGDQVDDLVELRLRGAAAGHYVVKARQDIAGGCGGGQRHGLVRYQMRRVPVTKRRLAVRGGLPGAPIGWTGAGSRSASIR